MAALKEKPALQLALYLTVYIVKYGGQGWNRTSDTGIFSRVGSEPTT